MVYLRPPQVLALQVKALCTGSGGHRFKSQGSRDAEQGPKPQPAPGETEPLLSAVRHFISYIYPNTCKCVQITF